MNLDDRLTATSGDLYNFTESQILCNGTISSIQFCYVATSQNMNQEDIFRFLIIKQNRTIYTLDCDINVSSIPHMNAIARGGTSRCVNIGGQWLCCDAMQLHFYLLPSYNYTFGISAINSRMHLLLFNYSEETFNDSPLPLLRLQIGITCLA